MGTLFSNTLIYRAEFCFPSISYRSAFPETGKAPQTITDPPPNSIFENSCCSFLKSCHQHWEPSGPSKLSFFFYQETQLFPHFSFVNITFFFTQSTRIFLYWAVKAGTVFLFRYSRFGDSWRSWETLRRVMGKFWDFCRSFEFDCL